MHCEKLLVFAVRIEQLEGALVQGLGSRGAFDVGVRDRQLLLLGLLLVAVVFVAAFIVAVFLVVVVARFVKRCLSAAEAQLVADDRRLKMKSVRCEPRLF